MSSVSGTINFLDQTRLQTSGLTGSYSFSNTTSTEDISVQDTGANATDDPLDNQYERLSIGDLTGVSSFTFTISFSEHIAARDDANLNITANGFDRSRPFGAGLGIFIQGSTALDAYNVSLSYGGIVSTSCQRLEL